MLKLEQVQKNAVISGLVPGEVVRIISTDPVGDQALTVYYKTADGAVHERMLYQSAAGHQRQTATVPTY